MAKVVVKREEGESVPLKELQKKLDSVGLEALLVTHPINRRYVTQFTGTSGVALITGSEAFLITDFRYITQAEEQAPAFTVVRHGDSIWQTVASLCAERKVKTLGFEAEHVTFSEYEQLNAQVEKISLRPTKGIVEALRIVKRDKELKIMEQAARIVDRTYEHICSVIRPGMTEREVALELEMTMRKLGASSSSFDIIVASGKRSALPHGTASDKVIEPGDFVTMDFGALYGGYCSDITRTVVIGEATDRQRELYGIVLKAQTETVKRLKPGMSGKAADAIARDIIKQSGYGDYFGHGTGHGLGMEVHEAPRLSPRGETVLKPGMVVTVEPGIYIPDFGGVRIEDDVLITDDGCRRLTHSRKELVII